MSGCDVCLRGEDELDGLTCSECMPERVATRAQLEKVRDELGRIVDGKPVLHVANALRMLEAILEGREP